MLSVIVPYRPDGGARQRSWDWLAQRYAALLPDDVEMIIEGDDGGSSPAQFNHPLAINRGVKRSSGDVLMIADCDTAFDPVWVMSAYQLVRDGAPWVLPLYYEKLDQESTERVLSQAPDSEIGMRSTEWIGTAVSWSGLVVVPRQAMGVIGGYDERFAYWGADDACFAITMEALWGHHERLDGSAMHLWHPAPLTETYGHERHPEQHALCVRYEQAAGNTDAVRQVRFGRD